jgi:glycosyltransferase involved in cell wall biosynthesis
LISHIHNNSFDSQKPTVKSVLYRIAANKIKHTFWVSKAAQEGYYFRASVRNKSSVLYNVIDTEQLEQKANQAENQTAYDVVYLGRLTYPKNPERLVSVLEQAIAQRPDLTAAIIGAGELEEDVHRLVKEKNLSDNIHCLGFMNNPYGIVQNAKVMLMTSRWEGLPMCVLEALALGVPIVSTPTDGLQELLEDGQAGFLSDENSVLAESVLNLISDTTLHIRTVQSVRAKSATVNNREAYAETLTKVYLQAKSPCAH